MSLNPTRLAISRTGWITYAIAEVALFAGANLAANNSSHPGALSDVLFVTFIAGLVLGVVLGSARLIHHRSTRP